jgi:hypothetical protein
VLLIRFDVSKRLDVLWGFRIVLILPQLQVGNFIGTNRVDFSKDFKHFGINFDGTP